MMDRRRALMMQSKATPILPAEYQQVEWIEANSDAYINTSIRTETNSFDIYFKYYKQNQANTEATIVGCAYGSSSKIEIAFSSTANRLFAYSIGAATIIDNRVYDNINDMHISINSVSPYLEVSMDTGTGVLTASKTTQNQTQIGNATINLFCLFGAGVQNKLNVWARMYYARFVRKDGTDIANFVPCYVKATGDAGMYDTVSGTFYGSSTSNNFVKGPDVT